MTSQIKTVLLLALLSGIIIVLGGLMGGRTGVIIAFGLALVMNVGSYWYSDKIVLSMYHARELAPEEAPYLHRIVEELPAMPAFPSRASAWCRKRPPTPLPRAVIRSMRWWP